jgi:hypothetical protein
MPAGKAAISGISWRATIESHHAAEGHSRPHAWVEELDGPAAHAGPFFSSVDRTGTADAALSPMPPTG